MPIFSNNSTFPIYKFNLLDLRKFESYQDIENFIFTDIPNSKKSFEDVLKDSLKNHERQHLFEIITLFSLKAIFNKSHRKITKHDDIKSSSIRDIQDFLLILNMRIDLDYIEDQLELLSDNEHVKVNKSEFISSLINFTYKYIFVKFANLIYCNVEDDVKDTMCFEYYNKIYLKYKKLMITKNYNSLNYNQMKRFINNYNKSFNSDITSEIEERTKEILDFSNFRKLEIILNSIIETNIVFDEKFNLTPNKKNKILLPFYKSITCVLLFPNNKDLKIDDPDLITSFRKFRLKMKKKQ